MNEEIIRVGPGKECRECGRDYGFHTPTCQFYIPVPLPTKIATQLGAADKIAARLIAADIDWSKVYEACIYALQHLYVAKGEESSANEHRYMAFRKLHDAIRLPEFEL